MPVYVPQDGLVAWYSLNENGINGLGVGPDGELSNIDVSENRFGQDGQAAYFSGNSSIYLCSNDCFNIESSNVTISVWAKAEVWNGNQNLFRRGQSLTNALAIRANADGWQVLDHNNSGANHFFFSPTIEVNQWVFLVYVRNCEENTVKLFLDGELIQTSSFICNTSEGGSYHIGSLDGIYEEFVGSIDDLGIWTRPLEDSEVLDLFAAPAPIGGCTDSTACNFMAEHTWEDGSCEYGCLNCGPGTAWNDSLSLCLPSAEVCAEGTIWDEGLQQCVPINSCPEDLNYDGIIGVEDLLTLLSSFGTPCDPQVAEWTCGDPVLYHGYDYETVLIGEQCWFAENLRTFMYRNGDEIPFPISDQEWTMLEDTGDGGMAYPNESVGALNEFGALYNWNAVIDNRQLCPQGWHIPSHIEWGQMETFAGMEFSESLAWQHNYGNVGDAIKSAEWNCPAWNGQNAFGFSALPAGYRANGGYDSFGSIGYLWSSSSLADLDWSSQEDHGVFRFVTETGSYWFYDTLASGSNIGISARCIKD